MTTQTDGSAAPPSSRHALVIGCGIAGMTSAEVLSKHFDRVTIIERDLLPAQPAFRTGKPQGRHGHVLLQRGQRHLESIFPGFVAELKHHGAIEWECGPDPHWYYFGGWRKKQPAFMRNILASLHLLEHVLRSRVQKNPKIQIMCECTVEDLISDGHKVLGVKLAQHKSARGRHEMELRSELVVDASGRRSKAPVWLTKLGFAQPSETKVEAYWGYSSRYYEAPPATTRDWQLFAIHPTPPESRRLGIILPLEKNIWHVTLCGNNKDYPPDDAEGFLDFSRGLASWELYDVIKNAKPISGVYGYRYAENCRRHYEKLPRFLEGFVVLGDAACQFNPIYGQGMSVAAIGASRLDACMMTQRRKHSDGSLEGLAKFFQKALARDLWPVWLITITEDLRMARDTAPGKHNPIIRFLQGYVRNVIELAKEDALAYRLFFSVLHLVASPFRLFHPMLLLKVILHVLLTRRPPPELAPEPEPEPAAPSASSPPWMSGEAWAPISGAIIPPRIQSGPVTPPSGVVPPASKDR